MILHAHALSPFLFMTDILQRGPYSQLWKSKIAFPLRQLSAVISANQWSNHESEEE
jgi:hypothetical protein